MVLVLVLVLEHSSIAPCLPVALIFDQFTSSTDCGNAENHGMTKLSSSTEDHFPIASTPRVEYDTTSPPPWESPRCFIPIAVRRPMCEVDPPAGLRGRGMRIHITPYHSSTAP
ncbi:hypothetical protein C7212DRAFT_341533 [Tuber magnatum]|uniref:Secreted protein n=1 Tax=Tuber magnatum TaxID=42249 RepID=A0A317SZQ1_9PEZI|nr:hypothetical protein C7212DRAFT_341533 [Tuber magnatum]